MEFDCANISLGFEKKRKRQTIALEPVAIKYSQLENSQNINWIDAKIGLETDVIQTLVLILSLMLSNRKHFLNATLNSETYVNFAYLWEERISATGIFFKGLRNWKIKHITDWLPLRERWIRIKEHALTGNSHISKCLLLSTTFQSSFWL